MDVLKAIKACMSGNFDDPDLLQIGPLHANIYADIDRLLDPPFSIPDTDLVLLPRHPRANTAFMGFYMVVDVETLHELEVDPDYNFEDALGSRGFCMVGDDPILLVELAQEWHQ